MTVSHSSPAGGELSTPPSWTLNGQAQRDFFPKIRSASHPLLICDYDGTLAPFHKDKMQAYPMPGVTERLEKIASGRTRLAFVSGRPVSELITLLPLAANAEIWGMHGREHRTAEGEHRRIEPSPSQRAALDQSQTMLARQGLGDILERKAASVALHWRTIDDAARRAEVEDAARQAFSPHAGSRSLALLPFDGGLELRAEDYTKAHATEALLATSQPDSSAFLGDDTTDEDAFRAIRGRGGLGLLVRDPVRPSHARFVLRPPEEVLDFLDEWAAAAGTRAV